MKKKFLYILFVLSAFAGCSKNPQSADDSENDILRITAVTLSQSICDAGSYVRISMEYSYDGAKAVSIDWEPDGGRIIETYNPQIIYWLAPNTSGIYRITITVTDSEYTAHSHITIQVLGGQGD
ncbi:PKD domain-containing protein [bacterium]|nr:PKD domain-containing protein [bacterium]